MLDLLQIDAIADAVARAFLPPDAVIQAHSWPDSGEDGEEQLRVMLVIREKAINDINGENALNTISELQQRLLAQGENRFAVVEFASDLEIAADGGS